MVVRYTICIFAPELATPVQTFKHTTEVTIGERGNLKFIDERGKRQYTNLGFLATEE